MRKPLLLLWALSLCILIPKTTAFNQDNDLIFDDQPPIAAEKSEGGLSSALSWPKNFLSRVKRDIFDFWNSSDKTEEKDSTEPSPVDSTHSSGSTERSRESTQSRTTREVDDGTRFDDEDRDKVGSGDIGSGDPEEESRTLFGEDTKNKKYINRATFFIQEFWQSLEDENENNDHYNTIKRGIEEGLKDLLNKDPSLVSGSHSAHLVKFSKTDAYDLTLAVVDIFSHSSNSDVSSEIQRAIEQEVRRSSRIGDIVVRYDQTYPITIRSFGEQNADVELGCENGILCNDPDRKCLPIEFRCDGIPQCPDGYDENDCPVPEVTTVATENKCRGDDVAPCPGTSEYICADQICDGRPDCRDGSDESNCTRHCLQTEFMCDIKRCIPSENRCDGIENCRDKTDEQNCPKKENYEPICPRGRIACPSTGVCLNIKSRCDGVEDCPDGTDEEDCPCDPSTEWTCDNQQCIDISEKCNGRPDCDDESDERDGLCSARSSDKIDETCENDEFRCADGLCIAKKYRCDGHKDCKDGSDENGCIDAKCTGHFRCDNGYCINRKFRCDGMAQCNDESDERGCSKECSSDDFRCLDGTCIPSYKNCNKIVDCPSGEDEQGCEVTDCFSTEFKCKSGGCIVKEYVCDNVTDCKDKSDEEDCPAYCAADDFRCYDDQKCVRKNKICDGIPDCGDRSDEFACKECKRNEFKCGNDRCIPIYLRCNGANDCGDRSDEEDCNNTISYTIRRPYRPPPPQFFPACRGNEFTCRSGNQCIDRSYVCDGEPNCQDGSDEYNCGGTYTRCRPGEFSCRSGQQCVPESAICNKQYECSDRSDEENCISSSGLPQINLVTTPTHLTIKQGEEVVFQCRDTGDGRYPVHWVRGNGKKMPRQARYSGSRLEIPNIQMGEDGTYICEALNVPPNTPGARVNVFLKVTPYTRPTLAPPRTNCRADEATCFNRQCIKKSQVCDGKNDCADKSDEYRCSSSKTDLCEPNEQRCDNRECVIKSWWCDGQSDCADGSDERNCGQRKNGTCYTWEFECASDSFCIPLGFRCDTSPECKDGSDEIGCYMPRFIPPYLDLRVEVQEGATLVLKCSATGVPTPRVTWRLNWRHIPKKCKETSVDGVGTLVCPNMRREDAGAYSCEVLQRNQPIFYDHDAIVEVISRGHVCRPGTFNALATRQDECLSCFCFGKATECSSADLFVYQLPPPRNDYRLVPVRKTNGNYEINMLETSPVQRYVIPGQDGFRISAQSGGRDSEEIYQYYVFPDSYHSNQLNSFGGYIKYKLSTSHEESWKPLLQIPDVIIQGNGKTLVSKPFIIASRNSIDQEVSIRIFQGEWDLIERGRERTATRADIMTVLENVENILIRTQYYEGPAIQTSITNIQIDSASVANTGQGQAAYVEQCRCPAGYQGQSCEKCAPGYRREGGTLGVCTEQACPRGTYGAPDRGIPCQRCPCPLTSGENQFAQSCRLDSDNQVTCDCPIGYQGRRCERCDYGYIGNPMEPGNYCRREEQCSSAGSRYNTTDSSGRCQCKSLTTGDRCDQCMPNSFFLSGSEQSGCLSCFCMGVTQECRSSDLYRDQIFLNFMRSDHGFKLAPLSDPNAQVEASIEDGQLVFDRFNQEIYYWVLPSTFLEDKVTSYGGDLTYKINYTPAPGGQSSKNNAADVIMNSINGIKLSHFSQQRIDHGREVSVAVPLVETAWQRDDGGDADRETFLMALSDIQSIYIKATYTTNTVKAALISIAMDTATNRNTGRERALAVEECSCPEGYTGTSCEDCAPGFARTDVGFYLGTCERCNCNGHSDECDPITKDCIDCRDNTQGRQCEECIEGYRMVNGVCVSEGGRCQCDPRGSTSQECINGRCLCKANVVGDRCNECRRGSFHLSAENELGCTECYCFGQTRECRSGGLNYTPVPITILDDSHGFTLSDGKRTLREQLYPNFRMSEIGFRASSRLEPRFWSLPSQVTGDQILSYGGELTFTIRFTDNNPTETIRYGDRAVMVTGNGVTIFHPLTLELRPNSAEVITIKLEERNFRTLSPRSGMRPVSRAQMLDVLARVESILVEAATGPSVEYSYVSDVTLEKAARINLGKPAHNVETCSCPPGFKGTSCQSCIDGYYKDYNNKCKPCPCENGGRCQLRPDYTFTCECRSEWAGERCEISASLVSVSLSPAGALRPSVDAKITFHCEFNATYEVFAEMSEIYGGLRGPSDSFPLMKVRHPYEFITSGSKELTVRVTPYLKAIDCTVYNKRNQAVANVKTFISPVQDRNGTYDPPPQEIQLEIVEYPPEKTIQVGGTIRLECRGNSREGRVNIVWSKSGEPFLPLRATDDRNGLLSIRDAVESDTGTYVCTGHDGYSSHAISITILVVGKQDYPPLISIEPPLISVMENEPISIVCNTRRGSKASIDWRRISEDGQPVPLNPQIDIVGGRLSISAARKEDQGDYVCIARNNAGATEERVHVEVRSFPNPIEEILLIEPQNLTINSGNTIKITCSISNYDDSIELQWRRDRRPIGLNHKVYQSGPSAILELLDVTPADSGAYICTGIRRSTTPRRIGEGRAYIQVIDGPATRVTIRPERITVNVNEEIRLICQADSAARLTWSKSGSQLPPTAQLSNDQRTLYIPQAQRSHTGIYICNANLYGTESTGTAMVQVEQTIVPAIDITPSGPLTLRLRQSHRIKCKASGYPEPNVYWIKENNQRLPPNFESRDGILYINDMSLEGEGSYVCVAENRAGRVTGSIYISLRGRPIITMNHRGTVFVNSGDQFSLECIGEGEPTPSVLITKTGQQSFDAYGAPESLGSARIDIYSITEEDEGEYVCKGRNELGEETKSVRVYINGRTPLRPGGDQTPDGQDYPPKNVRVQYLFERTNNSFECKYNDEGPDKKVKWVRNDGRPLPPNVVQIDTSIHFLDVQPEHEGYYTCQLQSRSGSVLKQKTINFIVKGYKRVRLIPNIQVVRLGGNAMIQCVLEGEPDAKIEWKGVNRDLPDRVRVTQNTIFFEDMQEYDEGEYLCIATTRQFTGESKARVVVKDDSEKPRPIVKVLGDQERKVSEGDSIQVQCSVDRSGENVVWTRENEPRLPPSAIAENNVLRFENIRRSDTGTYICSVLTPGSETGWDMVKINVLKRCSNWEKRCPDGECVPFGQNCEPSRYTRMNHDAEPVTIKIEQSIDLVRVGDKVDLTCKTTGVLREQPRWEILVENEEAKKSTSIIGKVLRIQKVLPSHGGKYRCFATAEDGQQIESVYALVVQGDAENQRKAAKMKRAIVGETVELECDQGLEPPTTFKWIRGQGKAIPNAKNQTLRIEKVSQSDAGEYICVASNSAVKIDFPTFLVVKGTIPRFSQNSYIKLRGLPHSSYLRTELNLMVKPESDGLILYTSDNKSRDFISLGLRNGRPEFRFDVGSGEAVIISNVSMPFYEWSNITIKRERREGKMWVNGRGPVVGTSQGRFQGLDLSEPVFLGSVPNFTDIKPAAGFSEGFQGCISHFSISDQPEGLSEQDSLEWNNVKECEICKEDSCQNNGVCQEEPNYRGYKCMCPKGFTGVDCERMGTSCYEGLCGDGECQNHDWSFKCHCKLGTYGENCEHRITVTVPSFNTHSHLSYAVPISGNKFMIEMDIKPKDQRDGVFFYAVGQHPRRDFVALAVRDQFVVLTLSLENEPTIVESQNRVEINRWTKISIEKKQDRVALMVDGESSNALVPRNNKALTLNTLYFGGYDRLLFSAHDSILVKDGFVGCIRNIHVDRRPLGLFQSLTGSSNVEQCHGETGGTHLQQILGGENCPDRPCKNGGVCNRQHNRQFCVCNEYFQGDYCEMETPCKMDHFCRPHGECKTFNDGSPNSPGFKCHCHFGYTGTYCNEAVHITSDLEFNKHSYVELPESLLPGNVERKVVSFMIQTSSPGGLVFWQGREQHTREQEYFSIAVVNGHIETTVHEYTNTMRLKSRRRVDDDRPHNVTIVRYPGELQMSVDGTTEATATGENTLNNDSPGNIFIGGIPDIEFNTGGKFEIGFEGCFAALRINGRAPVNFHELQIDARNISPCSSDLLGSYNEINK